MLEKIWSILAVLLVLGASVLSGATPFITALSLVGIVFVLGVSFKRPESQLVGAAFCGFLAYASFGAGFFANAAVNGLVLLPASIYGYYVWKRRKGARNLERSVSRYTLRNILSSILIATAAVFFFIYDLGGALPILDAFTGVLPVFATFLMIGAYREQWLLWIPYNFIQAVMWFSAASLQPAVLAIFVLKVVFLINSLIGFYNWRKGE